MHFPQPYLLERADALDSLNIASLTCSGFLCGQDCCQLRIRSKRLLANANAHLQVKQQSEVEEEERLSLRSRLGMWDGLNRQNDS